MKLRGFLAAVVNKICITKAAARRLIGAKLIGSRKLLFGKVSGTEALYFGVECVIYSVIKKKDPGESHRFSRDFVENTRRKMRFEVKL